MAEQVCLTRAAAAQKDSKKSCDHGYACQADAKSVRKPQLLARAPVPGGK